MAIEHARPGEVIDLQPLGRTLTTTKTSTLFKTEHVEVIRLVLPTGKEIPEHRAPGEITVHCLEGKIAFMALGVSQEMEAGQMLYLAAEEPHSLKGIRDATALVTILLGR